MPHKNLYQKGVEDQMMRRTIHVYARCATEHQRWESAYSLRWDARVALSAVFAEMGHSRMAAAQHRHATDAFGPEPVRFQMLQRASARLMASVGRFCAVYLRHM